MRRTAEEAAQTKAALLEAALFQFAEHGVAATKLADVAQRAGLTRGAVYHHFTDKTALYAAVIANSWDSVTAPVWAVLDSDGPVEDRLREFLVAWLRRLREDRHFRALLTITLNASYGPDQPEGISDGRASKSYGLADWLQRLETFLAGKRGGGGSGDGAGRRGTHADDPSGAAAGILAWLCGTALLAATDPDLLPPSDASGVALPLRGALP
ncbi:MULTISPECIES: TetR family transcriptional regulator [Streptomyces]|uniref:TetR family transcriptional regulator n=1 Tax=Streptomyces TaxID=1883 RepID=UPI00084BC5F4|nr:MULTISPECIES: TetR family transcriptional regulator [Streptomyces]